MLQITDICKQYKTGNFIQKALNHVSLNLRDNEFVSILGPSGSGKTTFLNIIGGLDRYDSGDLIINGISTKKYKDRDWDSYRNHTIGFVFQSYNLIPHQTILSNVELALTISGVSKAQRREKAIDALTKVGLGQQIHKKPNQLSGGQMQRVAIARALVNDPDILLADEPTGALDSETSIQVMDLLKEVAKDRLVVMVTHNPKLAKEYATRIVTLKDGVILDDTNPYHVESFVPQHRNMGKTSMSLLTSLSLSFNNLKTKKGRTFLTSFAGSIGIIGIALILSLSNGVNTYIQTIEEDTLSEYPLQITSTGIDMSSILVDDNQDKKQSYKNDIQVANMMTTMFSKIGSNDLESLKSYIQSNQKQLKNKNVNIFTGNAFEEKNSQFDLSSLFIIDQNKMQSAFKFNTQALQLDFTNLNQELTNLSLPTLDMNQIINQIQFNVSSDQLDHLANSLLNGYLEYEKNHPEVNINQATQEFINYLQTDHARQVIEEQVKKYIEDGIDQNEMQQIINAVLDDYKKQLGANDLDITKINEYLMSYLNSQEAKNILTQEMTSIIQSTNIETQISQIMSQYMQSSMQNLSSSLQRGIQKSMMSMSSSMENAFQFDSHAFAEAMSFSGDENDFMSIISSMMTSEQDSYDNNIKKLGYADFKKPASISIYPKNFESKEKVIHFLDTYNHKMEKTNQEDKVITYTDFVGTLMSSVTDIVNVISYVLVAFVGISLVVSSIMIGVITYISVLERKKEIGILRAIGASKRNISQVFNAETFIIGLFAGLIGIIITLLALIPANIVIHNIADTTAVNASLPPVAGIVLIILSVILTLLGGIVPSKKAAKEDPVTALRTD